MRQFSMCYRPAPERVVVNLLITRRRNRDSAFIVSHRIYFIHICVICSVWSRPTSKITQLSYTNHRL